MSISIKQFIDEYPNCPKCQTPLTICANQGHPENLSSGHIFDVNVFNNILEINITSNYFVNPNQNKFEFSISVVNGRILHGDMANRFISLYDLDIILFKACQNCKSNSEDFFRSIRMFYDRSESVFQSQPFVEHFNFIYDDNVYSFTNNYISNKSTIVCCPIRGDLAAVDMITTPYIPFEKFNFTSESSLFSKINSILLLI